MTALRRARPGRGGPGRREAAPARGARHPGRKSPRPTGARRDAGSAPPAGALLAGVEELELTIEKLVSGGDGLARFEGLPIFVARSAPGDRLRARLVERRPDYGRAEILEILTPGPGRRSPPCPHFARCGGCDLQHLEDELQVALKVAATIETLARLSGLALPEPVTVAAGRAWGYRLRAQLHVRRGAEGQLVGYFARGSRELVPVAVCPILVPQLEELIPELGASLGDAGPRRLDLAAGGGGTVDVAPPVPGLPHGELQMGVGRFTYRFDARCFFQAHRELVGRLVEEAVGEWSGEDAIDLYAGVGLFSLPLADHYRQVTAVEGDRIAARFARANARHQRQPNLTVVNRAVETWLGELRPGAARILLDPPRGGLTPRVVGALLRRGAQRLTYVSCHPAALARDLRALSRSYRLERVALLDMFPQSGHMEVVAQLAREDQGAQAAR